MGRPVDWKPPPGVDANTIIRLCIRASAAIFGIGGIKYESRCFRTGIVTDGMELVGPTIKMLLKVGLHFDQTDIENGIRAEVHENELYTAAVRQQAANKGKSTNELLIDSAYCLRTILAHTLVRCRQHKKVVGDPSKVCQKTHPAWLRELYPMVEQYEWDESPVKPAKSKCSFVLFRGSTMKNDNDDDDDDGRAEPEDAGGAGEPEKEDKVVFEGFDLGENKGMKRFASGTAEHACKHQPNPASGFIQAVFRDGTYFIRIPCFVFFTLPKYMLHFFQIPTCSFHCFGFYFSFFQISICSLSTFSFFSLC